MFLHHLEIIVYTWMHASKCSMKSVHSTYYWAVRSPYLPYCEEWFVPYGYRHMYIICVVVIVQVGLIY
jgi:hypothetical protein